MLSVKKQEILAYINAFTCTDASLCNYIGFGAKPCGGPKEYLVYPSGLDQNNLEALVRDYNEMDRQYNIQMGFVSDCSIVNPPLNMDCLEGLCSIIN